MKISLDDFFRNSFVITIDDKRLSVFYSNFNKRFPGLPLPRKYFGFNSGNMGGAMNCMLSHVSIVRMAKCLDLPFVAIFEDDAYPRIDACDRMDTYLSALPESKLVTFGWIEHERRLLTSAIDGNVNYRIANGRISGSHSYILFKSAYDSYIEKYNEDPYEWAADSFYEFFGDSVAISRDRVFIQFTENRSMHNYVGFLYDDSMHKNPPEGF